MTTRRTLALAVGVAATVTGFALVAGVSFGLRLTDVFLTLVAGLAAVQGLRYVQRGRETTVRIATTGDPEVRVAVPVPGDDFDDQVVTAQSRRGRWTARDRIEDRLEETAVRTLVARAGHTRSAAEALVEEGSWTDDVVAARFLGAAVSVPLATRVRLLLTGQSTLSTRIDRTIAAIERLGRDGDGDRTASAATDGRGEATTRAGGGDGP